jgi:hypothetical protein
MVEVLLIGDDDRSKLMTFINCVLRALDHTDHQVDIERDHAFDLPESCHIHGRTC